MKVEKILIFTTTPFPYGMAATNRIISYAKGFIENGKQVEVICMNSTENADNIFNLKAEGYYQGIRFIYLSGSTVKSNNFILRRFHKLTSLISLFIFSINSINNVTASIYYSSNTSSALVLWFVNKLSNGIFLKEESEYPDIYLNNKNYHSKYIFRKIHYKLFDGFLLMTKRLILYFSSKTKAPCIQIPMTVELDRFENGLKKSNEKTDQIIYTGILDDSKDGIDILINAFAKVVKKHNNYELHLYGSAHSKEKMQKYYEMVKQLEITQSVYFMGRVSRDVITSKIKNARILVLPRPDSIQAQNGFPTKLGEYLATGNPTLVTSVGEIPDYLTDSKNSFIAIPGDVLSLKNKMLEIIENYPKAKEVGLRGREVAKIHFNNISQTKKIISFIENSFSKCVG